MDKASAVKVDQQTHQLQTLDFKSPLEDKVMAAALVVFVAAVIASGGLAIAVGAVTALGVLLGATLVTAVIGGAFFVRRSNHMGRQSLAQNQALANYVKQIGQASHDQGRRLGLASRAHGVLKDQVKALQMQLGKQRGPAPLRPMPRRRPAPAAGHPLMFARKPVKLPSGKMTPTA
ncbi:MAG: hypothetical protein MRY21_04580 [Simkaniaceae bacterium]|nr:hypothetical protein [Simkaniaceae bacterium]